MQIGRNMPGSAVAIAYLDPPKRRWWESSLRVRLVLFLLLVALGALGIMLSEAMHTRQREMAKTEAQVLALTRLTADNQAKLIAGARDLLMSLARLPELQGDDRLACHTLLAQLQDLYPNYTGFGLANLNGDLVCSSYVLTEPINVADRLWFKRVLATNSFAVGEYQVGRLINKPVLAFGYPVRDAAGQIQAVLSTGLDLSTPNRLVTSSLLPDQAVLVVVDHDGIILTRDPDPQKWIGRPLPDKPIIQALLRQGGGVTQATGVDGITRLFAYTPVPGTGGTGMYLGVGLTPDVAFAEINQALVRNLTWLGATAFLALVILWVGTDMLILRRVEALVNAAQRLRHDLTARTGLQHGGDEFGQLARAFDEMAAALQQHEVNWMRLHAAEQQVRLEAEAEVTARKQAEAQLQDLLAEKEVLLREVHHRVKNNLQAITNLLYLQSNAVQEELARQVLRESQNRIKSIALIHEKLYQSRELARLDFGEYLPGLICQLVSSYVSDPSTIQLKIEVGDITVDVDQAITLGIITNELVSNSLKHAFPGDREDGLVNEIRVELRAETAEQRVLTISDNGIGLPETLDLARSSSLGLQLVAMLVSHMQGTIESERNGGTVFRIRFVSPIRTSG